MAAGTRLPWAALAFAIAALLSAWNPLAAPFGLVVGIAAALIALRASVRGGRRPVWVAALGISLVAAVGSAVVLARTAGVGRKPHDAAIVATPPAGDVARDLDAAAERTRSARERAKSELEAIEPKGGGEPPRPRKR